jgi:hypothetical protein
MTPAEAGALLTVAAAFDNRKPDEDAAKAWSIALDGLRFIDARDAIVAHYKTSSEWLMPSKVIAEVKRIRAKRIAEHPAPTPPANLDPVETCAWLKAARARIADGETVPDGDRGELHQRHLPDLRQVMPSTTSAAIEGETR